MAWAERLIAGVYGYLQAVEPCADKFVTILDTTARQIMLHGERGEIEEVMAEVLETITAAGVSSHLCVN
jgi:hypothetical protein